MRAISVDRFLADLFDIDDEFLDEARSTVPEPTLDLALVAAALVDLRLVDHLDRHGAPIP